MRDTEFLKSSLIVNRGIYDNQITFENTLESFNNAITNNYAILLSVNMTKDEVLIVYHDDNLTRLMNLKDKINSINYSELNYLCPYHVPTVEEALKDIAGKVPVIINVRTTSKKHFLEKELSKLLDKYEGKFAVLSRSSKVIRWFNKNRPNYLIGEILTRSRTFSLSNFILNCLIETDFKSINVEYHNLYKIKKIKESSLVIGYLIDNQEKYLVYKEVFDNLIIDKVYELQMIKEIL